MAAKTSVFYLTERVNMANNTLVTDTIDLGAYVDVADRQGILIHEVDFIFQGKDGPNNVMQPLQDSFTSDATAFAQLTDLNRAGLVFADDRALVASGQMLLDQGNNQLSSDADLYPDNFGPTSAQGGRIVINDQMYFSAQTAGTFATNDSLECTVRIKCSVISLSQKDFMAIALQSTAADN